MFKKGSVVFSFSPPLINMSGLPKRSTGCGNRMLNRFFLAGCLLWDGTFANLLLFWRLTYGVTKKVDKD
jgi:hypothetical protein